MMYHPALLIRPRVFKCVFSCLCEWNALLSTCTVCVFGLLFFFYLLFFLLFFLSLCLLSLPHSFVSTSTISPPLTTFTFPFVIPVFLPSLSFYFFDSFDLFLFALFVVCHFKYSPFCLCSSFSYSPISSFECLLLHFFLLLLLLLSFLLHGTGNSFLNCYISSPLLCICFVSACFPLLPLLSFHRSVIFHQH